MADVTSKTQAKTPTGSQYGQPVAANASHAGHSIPVKDPDAIQEGMLSFWDWVEQNAKLIAAIVGVVIVAWIVYGIYGWFEARQERKAQEAYYALESKFAKIKEGFDRAKFQALMPEPGQTGQAPAASGDLAKDYGPALTDLETFAKNHAGTSAGAQAAILVSEVYLGYKKPDQAIEIAALAANSLSSKNLLANLARVQWGTALADKGDCQEAVKVWQKVLDQPAASFLHADVSIRSGLCYENLSQTEKARELYKKITMSGEESSATLTAKGLLRALDLQGPAAAVAPAKGN